MVELEGGGVTEPISVCQNIVNILPRIIAVYSIHSIDRILAEGILRIFLA